MRTIKTKWLREDPRMKKVFEEVEFECPRCGAMTNFFHRTEMVTPHYKLRKKKSEPQVQCSMGYLPLPIPMLEKIMNLVFPS